MSSTKGLFYCCGVGVRFRVVWGCSVLSFGIFQQGIENSVRGYCVFIIEVVVIGKLSIDVEFFYCVKVDTFMLMS